MSISAIYGYHESEHVKITTSQRETRSGRGCLVSGIVRFSSWHMRSREGTASGNACVEVLLGCPEEISTRYKILSSHDSYIKFII